MADKTIIAWTDRTFNPWMGCQRVSPGCKHCYAERMVTVRMARPNLWGRDSDRQVTSDQNWKQPHKWNREAQERGTPIRVFCGSLCDVFDSHHTASLTRPRLWKLIHDTPALDWQLLTKRPETIQRFLPEDWGAGYQNVWLGVTIESNKYVSRAVILRGIPAAVHFVSYEPALGPLDKLELTGLDWIIYGGESGPNYRPHDPQWARDMRDRCVAAGVPYFFKQSSAPRTEMGTTLDGRSIKQFPHNGRPRSLRLPDAGPTLL